MHFREQGPSTEPHLLKQWTLIQYHHPTKVHTQMPPNCLKESFSAILFRSRIQPSFIHWGCLLFPLSRPEPETAPGAPSVLHTMQAFKGSRQVLQKSCTPTPSHKDPHYLWCQAWPVFKVVTANLSTSKAHFPLSHLWGNTLETWEHFALQYQSFSQ